MRTTKNNSRQADLREMALAAGIGSYNAPMAIQFMNFLPSTTDPYAAGTIEIVKGMQRLLNKRGAQLEVDGGMGEMTVKAMMKYAGKLWYDKSWSQIYGDIMDGVPWKGWERESRAKVQDGLEGWVEELGVVEALVDVPIYRPGTLPVAALQIAVNRLVNGYDGGNFYMVTVDGRVGAETVRQLQEIAKYEEASDRSIGNALSSRVFMAVTDPVLFARVASEATTLMAHLHQIADRKGLPALRLRPAGPFNIGDKSAPPKPPAGTPGLPSTGLMAMVKSPLGIAAVVVGGLLVYKATQRRGR